MRTWMVTGLTTLMAGLLAGCSPTSMMMTGGKTAYQVMKGAEAKIHPLERVAPETVAAYQAIRLGEVTTDVPAVIPANQVAIIRSNMEQEFSGEDTLKQFPGGEKALIANVVCRFLKERGTFGGIARLDMVVTLLDAQTQEKVLGVFIEGFSESPLHGKAEHMGKANAAELVDYLVKKREGELEKKESEKEGLQETEQTEPTGSAMR